MQRAVTVLPSAPVSLSAFKALDPGRHSLLSPALSSRGGEGGAARAWGDGLLRSNLTHF